MTLINGLNISVMTRGRYLTRVTNVCFLKRSHLNGNIMLHSIERRKVFHHLIYVLLDAYAMELSYADRSYSDTYCVVTRCHSSFCQFYSKRLIYV